MASNPYKRSGKRFAPDGTRRRMDEHRWIMEQHLGRRLTRFEFVHHINGDKRDNRLVNLCVVSPKEHAAAHGQQKHPVTKDCVVCHTPFTPHPTHRARAKTCSKPCGYQYLALVNARPGSPRSRHRETAS